MKNLKYLIITIIFASVSFSCKTDDSGESALTLETGVVPDMVKSASTDGFFDLLKIATGENVNVAFSVDIAQGTAASTDVIATYSKLSGELFSVTLFSDISIPQEFNLSIADVVTAFSELNDIDDVELGDVVSISTRFTTIDGRVISMFNEDGSNNFGTNIANSKLFGAVIRYPVSCPSDIAGTYLVSSTGIGCCGVAPITNYQYTVTVTEDGGGSYSLSDYSGGAYDGLFCGPFGICGDASSGSITDVCGVLSGSAPDCCGDSIAFSGAVNEDGTWSVEVSSGFIFAESTWTKQ